MPSPYEILRVAPDADESAIEDAYRERAMETHPDKGGSPAEFRLVRAAYEELTDPDASGPPAEITREETEEEGDDRLEPVVEYLDYEVVVDHGWSLEDPDLFEKAAGAGLDAPDYGTMTVTPDESLLEGIEAGGCTWPYSCRGGACANCAVAVVEGELSMPASHVLPTEMTDRGIQLSCVGRPVTESLKVVYNVKHLPELDDLRLPPGPFERAHSDD